jgi:hypothetical protein
MSGMREPWLRWMELLRPQNCLFKTLTFGRETIYVLGGLEGGHRGKLHGEFDVVAAEKNKLAQTCSMLSLIILVQRCPTKS